MNVFELGIIAAPIMGIVAGVRASAGHGVAMMIVSGVAGLVVGLAAYFVPLLMTASLYGRVRRGWKRPVDEDSHIAYFTGVLVVLCTAASPFLAWFLSDLAVSTLFG